MKSKPRKSKKKKRITRADIKRSNKAGTSFHNTVLIIVGVLLSPIGGAILWFIFGLLGFSFSWAGFIFGTIISFFSIFLIGKKSGRKDAKCPKCKKEFAITLDRTEIIETYQKFERRTFNRYSNSKRYTENIPVDIEIGVDYFKCIKCDYTRKVKFTNKTDA